MIGKPVAASGTSLPKGFGTITRSDGTVQATYGGHPLYTFAADTAAGQIGGNGKNLSGGLWWAMTPSGAKLRRPRRQAHPQARAATTKTAGAGPEGMPAAPAVR